MCGIAGRINFRSGRPVSRELVQGMCDVIAHRGPDGWGVDVDRYVGLGHRRLSIIDVSERGRQPMSTPDGRLWITFNGEIYNFAALRQDLEARGHRFRTGTDTEAILHAYREYGDACLDRLRGMFAFALWDADRQRLLMARDRLGKKPLHVWHDADGLAFASEPKAFLADPSFVVEPDLRALTAYLTLQYVPAPQSAFKGVEKLPPGSCAVIEGGTYTVRRYWSLHYQPKATRTADETLEQVRATLDEAVRLRLVSDVPLGAFLSGGIDSGTIVALMARASSSPVKTFSIGFGEADFDELKYARLVAQRYATEHHEFIVEPRAIDLLPDIVWHYGEPYADSSALPTYCLSELTRKHVTVALNGDGGDECFAGYPRYVAAQLIARGDWLPHAARRALSRVAPLLPARKSGTLLNRARRLLEVAGQTPPRRYATWMSHFDQATRALLCAPGLLASADAGAEQLLESTFERSDGADLVDRLLDVDVNNYLPDDLLVKVDIATMAHSLEARSPLLDHVLMEQVAALAPSLKLRGTTTKYLLRQIASSLLPAAILDRPKTGFAVPIEVWFRGELRTLAHDTLLGPTAKQRGYFDLAFVSTMLAEHAAGQRNWHYQIWNLLMLELWHQRFVDQRPQVPRVASPAPVVVAGA